MDKHLPSDRKESKERLKQLPAILICFLVLWHQLSCFFQESNEQNLNLTKAKISKNLFINHSCMKSVEKNMSLVGKAGWLRNQKMILWLEF